MGSGVKYRTAGSRRGDGATPRTSHTHPLQIPSVALSNNLGRIGISFCPGKWQAAAMTGAWARDLEVDLDAVAAWGAAAVVTLVEAHELVALRVENIGVAVAARGMRWFHLPIPDVTAPGFTFEDAWTEAGPALQSMVRSGRDVFMHCKGGLGRAGTVAARLLVELGMDPEQAIADVRAARPGAIQVAEQEAYVRQQRRRNLDDVSR
jgi:ADP-ribosyl-[dinitrogen reductase] hydrolase